MKTNRDIRKKIVELIRLLERSQRPNGRWEGRIIETGEKSPSIFPTLYCVNMLDRLKNKEAGKIADKARSFILSQRSEDGSWNYLGGSDDSEPRKTNYPNDMDDTSLAVTALASFMDREIGDRFVSMKKIVYGYEKALNISDCGRGGPFNTWLVKGEMRGTRWNDIDPVVNSNISLCLRKIGVSMPGLDDYLASIIEHENYHSKYYDSPITVLYAIARAQSDKPMSSDILTKQIERQCMIFFEKDPDNALSLAHALSALIYVEGREELIRKAYEKLMRLENSWERAYPLYIEKVEEDKTYHIGSKVITMSAIIEALKAYENYNESDYDSIKMEVADHGTTDRDLEKARDYILGHPIIVSDLMRESVANLIDDMSEKENIKNIIILPIQAWGLLKNQRSLDMKDGVKCVALGLAGWTAWTRADDIRDGEEDMDAIKDGMANFSVLQSVVHDIIRELSLKKEDRNRIIEILGKMEDANSKENARNDCVMNIRERSIWKSMGAAVPMMAFMMKARRPETEIKACEDFFRHFILARQLSDDACDWPEDLFNGRKTPVTEWIEDESDPFMIIDMDMDKSKEIFDRHVASKIAREIRDRACEAIDCVRKIDAFRDTGFLEELPGFYLGMANKILERRESRKVFNDVFWNRDMKC